MGERFFGTAANCGPFQKVYAPFPFSDSEIAALSKKMTVYRSLVNGKFKSQNTGGILKIMPASGFGVNILPKPLS
jgi:hypothetical protein